MSAPIGGWRAEPSTSLRCKSHGKALQRYCKGELLAAVPGSLIRRSLRFRFGSSRTWGTVLTRTLCEDSKPLFQS